MSNPTFHSSDTVHLAECSVSNRQVLYGMYVVTWCQDLHIDGELGINASELWAPSLPAPPPPPPHRGPTWGIPFIKHTLFNCMPRLPEQKKQKDQKKLRSIR